ncbi:ABC transporter permease [Brucella sp. NBRC 12950]|uniref:ABC transporter permease n=1 Tax=Brucella sp. NBRC 12950 TaxID=2994518 RepID=UPI0024A0BC58|nr:ABC transporter permease [Brucella sp. NBRC 12950]GLU29155.1 peptide ABC transporter permease [Brucella sp. NBRC 12950]
MQIYIVRRIIQAIFVLWAAFSITFAILYLLPGDPVAIMLDQRGEGQLADEALIETVRERYGLDRPIVWQYVEMLAKAVKGDFGLSIESGQPVFKTILTALPETLKLAGSALVLAILAGGILAIWATYSQSRFVTSVLLSLPPLGVSIPGFWIGLSLMQLFSFQFLLFPAMGNDGLQSLVLPALTLALPTAAGFAQVFAHSLKDALSQPYIDTAVAKGASRIRVHLSHALRNATLPALTLIGISAGGLLGGSVVTEAVYSRTGIGRLTEIAVHARDIPMVQGLVLLSTAIFVLINLVIDLLYPLFDPRIVEHSATSSRREVNVK